MPVDVTSPHLDEFTLLAFAAGQVDDLQKRRSERHLDGCPECRDALAASRALDVQLRGLFGDMEADGLGEQGLQVGDPFYDRPEIQLPPGFGQPGLSGAPLVELAFAAAREGSERAGALVEAAGESETTLKAALAALQLDVPRDRYTVLSALQVSGVRIGESPERALALASSALARLDPPVGPASQDARLAERLVPLKLLAANAHLLAGQACNWTGEYDRGGWHLLAAWNLFPAVGATEFELALVEMQESQRRGFSSLPAEALALARRAARTFDEFGQDEWKARAGVAVGMALVGLERYDEAIVKYRGALVAFRKLRLWSPYATTLSSLGGALRLMGRLDDARREYERGLRQVARIDVPASAVFVFGNYAALLHASGHFVEAAQQFRRAADMAATHGLLLDHLLCHLRRVESLACGGDREGALEAFSGFQEEVTDRKALDAGLVRAFGNCLAGADPDFETLSQICEEAEGYLRVGLSRKRTA